MSMSQVKQPTSEGTAVAFVLVGVVLSIGVSLVIDILLFHPVDVWAHLGRVLAYGLEFALSIVSGLLLALPVLAIRPRGPLVPILVGLIAIPVNVVSDLLSLVFENLYYEVFKHYSGLSPFSGFGHFFSHQTTLTRLSYLMAPLAAVLLAVIRVRVVGSGLRTASASPYGPYPQPYIPPQALPYGTQQAQPYGAQQAPPYGGAQQTPPYGPQQAQPYGPPPQRYGQQGFPPQDTPPAAPPPPQ
jgi:hypothetical protein